MRRDRPYRDYSEYLNHQLEKTLSDERIRKERESFETKRESFSQMFARYFARWMDGRPKRALCAGSRAGAEVAALHDLGVDAVGIDIAPFPPYTQLGDIHAMPFETGSFDMLFTNVFDHSMDPEVFAQEIERVVKPSGWCLMQLPIGRSADKYRVFSYSAVSDVTDLFQRGRVVHSQKMSQRSGSINTEALVKL